MRTHVYHSMNRFQSFKIILPLVLALSWSCLQFGSFIDPSTIDLAPPYFVSLDVAGPQDLIIEFCEDIQVSGTLQISGDLEITSWHCIGPFLHIELESPAEPGQLFSVSGVVKDGHGNSTAFLLPCFGYNDRVPDLHINEFITRNSANHAEFVELLVLSDGNLGGVALYAGIDGDFDNRILFPSCEVSTGDFIVVHFRPQGIAEEIDEIDDICISGGNHAYDYARDFWVREARGLSSNNGILSLYTKPRGSVIDAVVYTTRTSASDTRYRGFGSLAMLRRAEKLVEDGGWIIEEEQIRPEDAVDINLSTATRSINRQQNNSNSRSRLDWYIVPTGMSTPGRENNTERFTPNAD